MPTPADLLCVRFQYGLINDVGVTPSDIFNENGNTLKTGLLIATRTIAIDILNSTFPQQRMLREHETDEYGTTASTSSSSIIMVAPPAHRHWPIQGDAVVQVPETKHVSLSFFRDLDAPAKQNPDDFKRQAVRLPSGWIGTGPAAATTTTMSQSSFGADRRLVFFTDDYPVVITSVSENFLCEKDTPTTECAIVSTTLCVLLEDGDDRQVVREGIIVGLDASLSDGSFLDAIPPENRLPES